MTRRIALISLPLVGQRLDPFGSIPAMPTAIPPLTAMATRLGAHVQVIDGFAEGHLCHWSPAPGLVARGLRPEQIAARVEGGTDLVGLSVHSVATDTVARQTLAALRQRLGPVTIAVGGAHPSFSPERFLEAGADLVIRGEGEGALARVLGGEAQGVVEEPPIADLDALPLPDFGPLPLEAYWSMGLGHGPIQGRYLNVSTSRGCSQGCRFCATPSLARGRWRGLSPERTVSLLEALQARHGVTTFHIEDDDFSADRGRVRAICERLLSRGLRYRLALPSGVRAASLDEDTVSHLAEAGCRYLSLAPESGSSRVLGAMGKVVDLEHLLGVAEAAVRHGIRVGCFLIVGYPGESAAQRGETARLVDRLIRLGVDDLSVFIWSPLPGAAAFELERGYERLEQLCWTPRWRTRYGLYEGARVGLYLRALSTMARARPAKVIASLSRVATGRFETKGEMTLNRLLRWHR